MHHESRCRSAHDAPAPAPKKRPARKPKAAKAPAITKAPTVLEQLVDAYLVGYCHQYQYKRLHYTPEQQLKADRFDLYTKMNSIRYELLMADKDFRQAQQDFDGKRHCITGIGFGALVVSTLAAVLMDLKR